MNQDLQDQIDQTLDLLALCFDTCGDLSRMAKGADAKNAESLAESAKGLTRKVDERFAALVQAGGESNPLLVSARDFIAMFSEGLGDISVEHWRHDQGLTAEDEG